MRDFPPVGEHGPELRTLPAGAHVYSAEHSRGLVVEYLDGEQTNPDSPDSYPPYDGDGEPV